LWVQVGGLKRCRVLYAGENADGMGRGLITQQRGEMEEFWVESPLDPGAFFQKSGREDHA